MGWFWVTALFLAAAGPEGQEPDRVLSFFGLLQMEKDPEVSDEEKVRRWREFVERTREQLRYAEAAVERWTHAERYRLLERAVKLDGEPGSAQDKSVLWAQVARAFEGQEEAERAKQRALHWKNVETKARVDAATRVEREGRPKLDRIVAWKQVVDWSPQSKAGKAARSRIDALQKQLVIEAQRLDEVSRIDAATRLRAWQDVLAGAPTPEQAKLATQRVQALKSP